MSESLRTKRNTTCLFQKVVSNPSDKYIYMHTCKVKLKDRTKRLLVFKCHWNWNVTCFHKVNDTKKLIKGILVFLKTSLWVAATRIIITKCSSCIHVFPSFASFNNNTTTSSIPSLHLFLGRFWMTKEIWRWEVHAAKMQRCTEKTSCIFLQVEIRLLLGCFVQSAGQ